MAIAANRVIISLLVMVSIIGVGIFIQVRLSRSQNKFLGLILPIISLLFSLMGVLGYATFTLLTLSVDGVVQSAGQVQGGMGYLGIFFMFLMTNIPTAMLGGIYLSERNKIKTNQSVEKMKIEDL